MLCLIFVNFCVAYYPPFKRARMSRDDNVVAEKEREFDFEDGGIANIINYRSEIAVRFR